MFRASFLTTVFLIGGAGADASPLTLEAAFSAARSNNPSERIEASKVRQAELRESQAKGALFPTIAAMGDYTTQDKTPGSTSSATQKAARINLSQPIFQGGAEYAALDSYGSLKDAQLELERAANITLFVSVARAYFQALSAQAETSNLQTTIKLSRERVTELQSRSKIGRTRASEVTSAQAQLAVLESQLELAKSQLKTAMSQLELTTGLENPELEEHRGSIPARLSALTTYLEKIQDRPDVKAQKLLVDANDSNVAIQKAGHFPTLDAAGNYYLYREGTSKDVDWDLRATLTIPLFAGGVVQSRTREAVEKRHQTELELERVFDVAKAEVKTAYDSFAGAMAQTEALEKALQISEKNYDQQVRDYRYSLVTNLDVLQSLNLFQETKRTLDKTRLQAHIYWSELQAAIGRISIAKE